MSMHTYTHLLFGAATGRCLFPEDYSGQAALIAGSIMPDLVMVPSFLLDRIRGKQPLAEQSPQLVALKELSHSLPCWLLAAVIATGFDWRIGAIFSFGVVFHVFIDALTHKTIGKHDPGMLWPLPGNAAAKLGIWEYRYGPGILRPKPFEAFVGAILIALILLA